MLREKAEAFVKKFECVPEGKAHMAISELVDLVYEFGVDGGWLTPNMKITTSIEVDIKCFLEEISLKARLIEKYAREVNSNQKDA